MVIYVVVELDFYHERVKGGCGNWDFRSSLGIIVLNFVGRYQRIVEKHKETKFPRFLAVWTTRSESVMVSTDSRLKIQDSVLERVSQSR
jgi:hypothetical protein